MQFETAQSDLNAVHRVGRKLTIIGKQAQVPVLPLVLVEDLQRPAPCRLLLIVDLAQVQHRALDAPTSGHPLVLDDGEVAVVLAILLPVCRSQKQVFSRMPDPTTP